MLVIGQAYALQKRDPLERMDIMVCFLPLALFSYNRIFAYREFQNYKANAMNYHP